MGGARRRPFLDRSGWRGPFLAYVCVGTALVCWDGVETAEGTGRVVLGLVALASAGTGLLILVEGVGRFCRADGAGRGDA